MSSAAKARANRANATQSTGPADTSRTRFNGLAHGLTSKQTVIPGENQSEYNAFESAMREDLRPSSAIENVLAERLIAAAWRLKRFTRVETAFLTGRIDAHLEDNPDSDADFALANLFSDPGEMARMRLFLRYQTAVQKEYDTAMRELLKAKAEGARRAYEQAMLDATQLCETEAEPECRPSTEIAFGFASQSTPEPSQAAAVGRHLNAA